MDVNELHHNNLIIMCNVFLTICTNKLLYKMHESLFGS